MLKKSARENLFNHHKSLQILFVNCTLACNFCGMVKLFNTSSALVWLQITFWKWKWEVGVVAKDNMNISLLSSSSSLDEKFSFLSDNDVIKNPCSDDTVDLNTTKLSVLTIMSIFTLLSNIAILVAILHQPGKVGM